MESQSNSPTCDPRDTDDIQNEQHVLLHCANPHVIYLCSKYASLFPPTGAHDVSTFRVYRVYRGSHQSKRATARLRT
jgi:hypothetical protein